jgi:hypothetical protein
MLLPMSASVAETGFEHGPLGLAGDELTDRERRLLDFENSWWHTPVPKDEQLRAELSLNPTRYYQQLNALIDRPAALVYKPLVVKRLRRQREARQSARSATRLATY